MIRAVLLAAVATNAGSAPVAEVYAPPGAYVVDVWAIVDTLRVVTLRVTGHDA